MEVNEKEADSFLKTKYAIALFTKRKKRYWQIGKYKVEYEVFQREKCHAVQLCCHDGAKPNTNETKSYEIDWKVGYGE